MARVVIDSVDANQGETVDLAVRLETQGNITSVSTFFDFDESAQVEANDQDTPQCLANEDLGADDTMFFFTPVGCTPGTDCNGVEAAILDTATPIADGSVIYTCTLRIAEDAAAGLIDLPCLSAGVMGPSDLDADAACISGSIVVNEVVEPTTPAGSTDTPTVSTPTTPVITTTPVATSTRRRIEEDDGCQVTQPNNTSTAWLLLVPALLGALRRRKTWKFRLS